VSAQPDIGKKYYGIVDLVFEVRADTDEAALIDESVAAQVTKSELQAPTREPSLPPSAGIEIARQIAAGRLSEKLRIRLTRRRR
jgi:hypothetical protein